MSIDPAQGFSLDQAGRTAERLAELERRLARLETGSPAVQAGTAAPTQAVRDGTLYAMDDTLGTRRLWVRIGGAWRYVAVT